MKILIAEFGNNPLGDINMAKEYIRIAKECGATLCKGQAFLAKDISGSMPYAFYSKCEMLFDEYVELIDYGKTIDMPVFFSIFSKSYEPLSYHQEWHKIAGSQVELGFKELTKKDTVKTIVSVPELSVLPPLKKSHILHVTPYMAEAPNYDVHGFLEQYYGRAIGLSCHCIGIEPAIEMVRSRQIDIVEKHFTLTRDVTFKGQVFRDALHACLPNELEILAKEIT